MRIVLLVLLLVSWAPAARAFTSAYCGAQVPAGETAYMNGDLDCGSAIGLGRNARLVMRGHRLTVRNPTAGAGAAIGILCRSRCAVEGPGTIIGPGVAAQGSAIWHEAGRLNITDLDISEFNRGVTGFRARTVAERVTVHDGGEAGIVTGGLKATDVTVRDHPEGVGISTTGSVKGAGLNVTGNWIGIQAAKAVQVSSTSVTGNGFVGIIGMSIKLTDTMATGNADYDLGSSRKPHLVSSTCDRSSNDLTFGATSWGVCSLD